MNTKTHTRTTEELLKDLRRNAERMERLIKFYGDVKLARAAVTFKEVQHLVREVK